LELSNKRKSSERRDFVDGNRSESRFTSHLLTCLRPFESEIETYPPMRLEIFFIRETDMEKHAEGVNPSQIGF
jgi:hypothetical protein